MRQNTSMSSWLLKRVSAAPGLRLYIPVHLAALSERCLLKHRTAVCCVLTGCLLQVVGEDVSGPPGRVQQHGGGAGRGGGRGGVPLPIQVHGEPHTWYLTHHHLSWILLAFLSIKTREWEAHLCLESLPWCTLEVHSLLQLPLLSLDSEFGMMLIQGVTKRLLNFVSLSVTHY